MLWNADALRALLRFVKRGNKAVPLQEILLKAQLGLQGLQVIKLFFLTELNTGKQINLK